MKQKRPGKKRLLARLDLFILECQSAGDVAYCMDCPTEKECLEDLAELRRLVRKRGEK